MGTGRDHLKDPHTTPAATRLALKLVAQQLGPVCERVATALVQHGMQQLSDLRRHVVRMTKAKLKEALIVLLQHNYAVAYLHSDPPTLRGPGQQYTLYCAAPARMLQMLRAPRYLIHIRDEYESTAEGSGLLAESTAQALLEHGRLKLEQVVQSVQSTAARRRADGMEQQGEWSDAEVRSMLVSLVGQRYVERAPPCTLPPPPKPDFAPKKKKAPSKPGSEEEAEEQRMMAQDLVRQEYARERFKLPSDLGDILDMGQGQGAGTSGAAAAGRGGGGAGRSAEGGKGGKRKRGSSVVILESEEAEEEEEASGKKKSKGKRVKAGDVAKEGKETSKGAAWAEGLPAPDMSVSEVLWRVNFQEFNRRFRNELLQDAVQRKYGEEFGAVVAALLEVNATSEGPQGREQQTKQVSVGEISGVLRRKGREEIGDAQSVDNLLSHIADDDLGWAYHTGTSPGGQLYQFNIGSVLDFLRTLQLEATVRDRFGDTGMRIWHLLLVHRQLEQKAVADKSMVPKEEARKLLYAMMRAGFVTLQDVPRTADHAPSRTFYTWGARSLPAAAAVAEGTFQAAGNLHARLAHELQRHEETLQLISDIDAGRTGEAAEKREEAAINRVKHVFNVLEASLVQLADMIALFADY